MNFSVRRIVIVVVLAWVVLCLGTLPSYAQSSPAEQEEKAIECAGPWKGKTPSEDELAIILIAHERWREKREKGGEQANLCGANLEEADLQLAFLSQANLQGAILVGANLQRAVMEGAGFQGADLRKANLQGARLFMSNLQGATLEGANLQDANLEEAKLQNADLRGANLRGAHLRHADLRKSYLFRADFREAFLQQADLREANLSGAYLNGAFLKQTNLQGAKLGHAILLGARLLEANLEGADLFSSEFKGADLTRTKLQGANVTNADMRDVILVQADLQKVNLENVNLTNADLRSANLADVNIQGATLLGANLFDANLQNVQFDFNEGALPDLGNLIMARNFSFMDLKAPKAVYGLLRELYKKAGLREQERQATYRIKKAQVDEAGPLEKSLNYIFLELTCEYGMTPGRPLRLIFLIFIISPIFYMYALRYGDGPAAIWAYTPITSRKNVVNRIKDIAASIEPGIDEGKALRERVHKEFFFPNFRRQINDLKVPKVKYILAWGLNLSALVAASLYFSLLSTFRLGWRDLNVGTWISRIQPRDYTLRASGWVKFYSGMQSLVCVYLLALWALTYFGRPFE